MLLTFSYLRLECPGAALAEPKGSSWVKVPPMPNDLPAAVAIGSGKLPPNLALALVPLLVLIVALDVYCLIDLARAKSVRNVPKWVWAIWPGPPCWW